MNNKRKNIPDISDDYVELKDENEQEIQYGKKSVKSGIDVKKLKILKIVIHYCFAIMILIIVIYTLNRYILNGELAGDQALLSGMVTIISTTITTTVGAIIGQSIGS